MKFIDAKTKVIPMIYVVNLQQILVEHGIDFSLILEAAKIPVSILDEPDMAITFLQFKNLLQALLKKTSLTDLGLQLGKRLNVNTHGDLGIAIMSSNNMHDAILLAIKYIKMQMPLIDLSLTIKEGIACIRIDTKLIRHDVKHFILDAVLASLHTMRTFLLGQVPTGTTVNFIYAAPQNTNTYRAIFGEDINFGHRHCEYLFPAEDLQFIFPLANPAIRKIAEEKCQQKLQELGNQYDFVTTVKRLLLATPGHFLQLPGIAQELHMSERTLKRRLQQLDTNYQEVLDTLRQELATNYLLKSDLSIAEISQYLNYNDPSNFGNAFKKWFGVSPKEYRDKA